MDVILTDAAYKKEEKLFIIKKKKKEERREPITVSYQLRDINTELVKAWQDIFAPHENVVVSEGDIFKDAPATDAIVSPANSFGFMDGGIELAYSRHFGLQLMSRLQETIDNEKDGELLVVSVDQYLGYIASHSTVNDLAIPNLASNLPKYIFNY
ncbi:uncharacterized protein LOC117115954, partial [Anneissia japonica]|uniref:uncharacterized protein LOC117115954 n=1 Tax=Anneissia japonica TaxID=1529436 RepID=UPI0014259E4A